MLNLLLSVLLLSSTPACDEPSVCRCRPISVEEALEQADGVFTATVVSVREVSNEADGRPGLGSEVRLRVHAAWKGVDSADVVIRTYGTSCDMEFRPGERYLVFGDADADGAFHTTYCSGTRRIEPNAENTDALGALARTWPDR